jgi:hypothetical protein
MTELNCYCVGKKNPWCRTCSQTSPPEPTGVHLVDPQDSLNEKWVLESFPPERVHRIIMLLEVELIGSL